MTHHTHRAAKQTGTSRRCQSCRGLRGICAEKVRMLTRHAHQRSHTNFRGNLNADLASTADCPYCFFASSAAQSCHGAGILSTMGSHIFRWMLARAIQASPFDVPCFTNMNFRIQSSHSPHMKMFVPVRADWTRRWWQRTNCSAHPANSPAEVRKERHTVSHNITVFASTLRTQKMQRVKLTLASQQPKQT